MSEQILLAFFVTPPGTSKSTSSFLFRKQLRTAISLLPCQAPSGNLRTFTSHFPWIPMVDPCDRKARALTNETWQVSLSQYRIFWPQQLALSEITILWRSQQKRCALTSAVSATEALRGAEGCQASNGQVKTSPQKVLLLILCHLPAELLLRHYLLVCY